MKKKQIVFITLSSLLFLSLPIFLSLLGIIKFNSVTAVQFDAELYQRISNEGYSEEFLFAFFPLLPLIWNFLSLSSIQVGLLNGVLFLIFLVITFKYLNVKSLFLVIFILTIPNFIFFFVPYTESLFFCSSTLILLGLKKENRPLLYLGLILSGLIRPAISVLIPAIVILYFLGSSKKKLIRDLILPILFSILGLGITVCYQYLYSSVWFSFYKAQAIWDNQIRLPTFPLRSWSGEFITQVDGFAALIGVFSMFIIGVLTYSKLLKKRPRILVTDYQIFSLLYFAGMTSIVLIYRGGSLFSLNRFLFASVFVIPILEFFHFNSSNILLKYSKTRIASLIFIISSIFWIISFNSVKHIQVFLKFELMSLYLVMLFFMFTSENEIGIKKYLPISAISAINLILTITFFIRYYSGLWIA